MLEKSIPVDGILKGGGGIPKDTGTAAGKGRPGGGAPAKFGGIPGIMLAPVKRYR